MVHNRQTPEQRRAVKATAVSLALIAIAVYILFIVMAGLD